MISDNQKPLVLADKAEEDAIARRMMAWINSYPDLPSAIALIQYEQLPADAPGMAVSSIQGTYITRRYIAGGHQAEYQFKIIYRIKPGTSNDKRLSADELLDQIGNWATAQKPDLGEGIRAIRIEPTTRSALFAAYENGDEDHQILMKLTYEVI